MGRILLCGMRNYEGVLQVQKRISTQKYSPIGSLAGVLLIVYVKGKPRECESWANSTSFGSFCRMRNIAG